MLPLPRIIYAQAKDGLLFRVLGYVSSRTQTPVLSTVVSGTLAAVLTCIFDLDALVDMVLDTVLRDNLTIGRLDRL